MVRGCLLIVLVVGGCATPAGTDATARAARAGQPAASAATWAALAADPTITAIDGDLALACAAAPAGTDAVAPRCDAVIVAADGARAPLGRADLLAAMRLDAGRLVLLTAGGELRLRAGADERVLATDARDPRVAPDRRIIVYTQYPPGGGPGTAAGRLVALDLDRGARWEISDDPLASSPFPIPGGEQTLYVSARGGLAALYVATPGQPPRQLTNQGRRTLDAGFVPVPGRELAWLDERRAIYTATYAGAARLWALDVVTGAARDLGPGRRPRALGAGVEAVIDGAVRKFDRAAITRALEVAP
jgi:hypothetical protein